METELGLVKDNPTRTFYGYRDYNQISNETVTITIDGKFES